MTEIVISNLGMLNFHFKLFLQHGLDGDKCCILSFHPVYFLKLQFNPQQTTAWGKTHTIYTPLIVVINTQLTISNLYDMIDLVN